MFLRHRLSQSFGAGHDVLRERAEGFKTRALSLRHLTALLFLLLSVDLRAKAAVSVPDWVQAAAHRSLPALSPSSKAVVLLNETTYTVGQDGRAKLHQRVVVRILRPQGREFAEPVIWYDKDSKLSWLHVWSIDPAGHEYALKDSDLADFSPPGEGGQLYQDVRAKVGSPPGRDPGGVVAYEFEQQERPYLQETNWHFQDELPRFGQSFTLVLPTGYHHDVSWAHHPPVAATDLGNNTYRWAIEREDALDLSEVPLSPDESAVAGRMSVHYSGPEAAVPQESTWQGIGEWYAALARDRLTPSPEIGAKAAELTAGKTDFYEKAEAIGEFVQQQIRYFVIERGIGGLQPHPAAEIFRGRYGDCKDKATLLSAMLSSVGIHSTLMLVDTRRGFVDPGAPSSLGNHAIAAIEIPEGYRSPKLRSVVTAANGRRYLIFDPTWEWTPFGQLESNLQGSYAILVEGTASQVIQLPVLSPEWNRVERIGRFSLALDGTLKGEVVEKRFGDLAEHSRREFLRDEREQQRFLDRSVGGEFVSASLTGLKVKNLKALNQDLEVQYQVQAEHFGSTSGPLLMIRPHVLGREQLNVDRKPRRVKIDFGETMQDQDSFDIELPEGYTVDEMPAPVKADFGFATYESSTELHGRTLRYARQFRIKELTLAPDRYQDVQRLAGVIAADEENSAVLKKAP